MLSLGHIFPVLAALAASVSAGLTTTTAPSASTVTKKYCTTFQSSKSTSPIKTSSVAITYTKTATKYTTFTPMTVKTPPPVTSTTTVVSLSTVYTTASQITDTFTSTSTILTTVTTEAPTVTISVVLTASTDTTVTSTSTIPAPAGFTPIQTSAANPNSKKREAIDAASPASGSLVARANAIRAANSGTCKGAKPQYPKSVACLVVVTVIVPKTVTSTAKTTKTITGTASTSTVPSTTVVTITSTILPVDASTTINTQTTVTLIATTTPVTTVVTTTTTTNTVQAPAATFYAQCSSNNFLPITYLIPDTPYNENLISGPASAYDCCVSCAQTSGCEVSAYFDDGRCYTLTSPQGTCDSVGTEQDVIRFTASNGCTNAHYG